MEKLIRDNIVDIAKAKGDMMTYRVVRSTEEMVGFLCKKLDEELNEYKNARCSEDKTNEAGDVLEVIDTLITLHPTREMHIHMKIYFIQQCINDLLNMSLIESMQRQKRNEKGGFRNGVIWIF